MGVSVITPHYNNILGLKKIKTDLQKQNSDLWEWIIVDDYSDTEFKVDLSSSITGSKNNNITLLFNSFKSNASVCRNIGLGLAKYDNVVFLDADDGIKSNFIKNRLVPVNEFLIFGNYNIIDEHNEVHPRYLKKFNYLGEFLKANFLWQTSTILWNRGYLVSIGMFDEKLERLQDVELSIRSLILSQNYGIVNNTIDFNYYVEPINLNRRPLKKICSSVEYLITKIHNDLNLNQDQMHLLSGYYYLCIKYYCRSNNRKDCQPVKNVLNLLNTLKCLEYHNYVLGRSLLKLYKLKWISMSLFLRSNRKIFK